MNNTDQVSPSTNQVDANNPQTPATPAATTAAPTPAANPQANPTTAAPVTNQPTNQPTQTPSAQGTQPTTPAAQSSQNQPHPVSKMFDSILKTMSGGPIVVTDPVTGQRREVQQSKGSMARAITAAALAGLFTPNQYRPGPFGGSVLDKGNTMAAAGQAGMQTQAKRQAQPQDSLDAQQARKLFTIQNNAKLAQQAAAMAHQQHAVLADTVKTNQDKFMGPLSEFDANRPAGTPSIFQAKGQTSDQVLAGGHSLTDSNVFIDGTTPIQNPQTGVFEDHPTYAVVRSTNADGSPITLKLPEEVTSELGKYSKPYEQAYKATDGNVMVPINNYMDAIHTYHTLNSVESFMNRVQKDVNPDGQKISLAAAYKNDPTGYWQAINAAEQAIAAGNGRPGEDTEDNVLTKIAATPGGAKLLDLVGTPQQVEDWKNQLTSKRKVAQEAGKIENTKTKAAVKPMTVSDAMSVAADPNETPERKLQAQNVINEKKAFDQAEASWKAQLAANKPNPNMMTGSMSDGTQVAGTTDELKAAGATGVTKLPAADQSKVSIARQLISPNGLLTNTEKDIAAFKPEELTSIGNRWNEFEAGTLGSGDPRYIALRTDARLLSTALMQAHVGSRGSESIMEHFSNLADAGKMDGDALKTAIGTERRYVTEKAMLPKSQPTTQPKAFSLGAWQKANPTGDVNAAKAAAQQAGYKVVQ